MQIEPDKDDKSISVVEVIHSRDREFEPFAFQVNDDSLPELVESYQPQERQPGRRLRNRLTRTRRYLRIRTVPL